jgi:apolipoprotein N-acyltransferase
VAWSELNGIVFGEDEAALVDAGRAIAREEGIHLVMALAVIRPGERLRENKLVAVDPAGAVVAEFHKARPVPGEPERPGDGRMPVFDTPLGRVGLAICFDLDFPPFVRQAGLAGVDLLVAPAADWAEVETIHATMARLRAIDNGVSLLRQTNWGISAAVDSRGRVRARMDHFRSRDLTLVAQLPTRRAAVLAPRLGDALPAACALALLGLAAAPLARGRAGARGSATASGVPQPGAARG